MRNMRVRKLALAAALCVFCAGLFSGCMVASEELDEISVIKALVFDAGEGGGFYMSACIADPDENGGETYESASVFANTLSEALSALPSDKKPFLGQCELVVFSERIARSGISDIVGALFERGRTGGAQEIMILRGEADDVFRKKTPSQIADMLESASVRGFYSRCGVMAAKHAFASEGSSTLIPVCRIGPDGAEPESMAVFIKGAMVYELSESEHRGAKWLLAGDDVSGAAFSVGPEEKMTGVKDESAWTQQSLRDGASGEFLWEIDCLISAESGAEQKDAVIKAAQAAITEDCDAAIARARLLKADFLGLGATAQAADVFADFWQIETAVRVRVRMAA